MRFQRVLITGAGGGLGRELVRALAPITGEFILLDRKKELVEAPPAACAHICEADLLNCTEFEKLVAEIRERHPRIDLVIASAGIDRPVDIPSLSWQTLQNHFTINVVANAILLRGLLPSLRASEAPHFAAIGSLAAMRGFPFEAAYCSSKSALARFMESARAEPDLRSIRLTTIYPGFIKTPMMENNAFRVAKSLTPAAAAATIVRGLLKRKQNIYFPRRTYFETRVLNALPEFLAEWVMVRLMKSRETIPKVLIATLLLLGTHGHSSWASPVTAPANARSVQKSLKERFFSCRSTLELRPAG